MVVCSLCIKMESKVILALLTIDQLFSVNWLSSFHAPFECDDAKITTIDFYNFCNSDTV